jgi:hypothetical protein
MAFVWTRGLRGWASDAAWWNEPAPTGPADLASRFESIGDNCELASVQRGLGVDQLAFFRWSSTTADILLAALDEDLVGGIDGSALRLELAREPGGSPAEYIVVNDRYGTQAHAFAREGEIDPARLVEREHRRLTLLRRKFLEDLRTGRRIYVFRSDQPQTTAKMTALAAALRRRGPNTLLWVGLAEPGRPPGHVEIAGDGLVRAYMDVLAPADNGSLVRSHLWPLVMGRCYRILRAPMRETVQRTWSEVHRLCTPSFA